MTAGKNGAWYAKNWKDEQPQIIQFVITDSTQLSSITSGIEYAAFFGFALFFFVFTSSIPGREKEGWGIERGMFFFFNYSLGGRIIKQDEFSRDGNLQLQDNAHYAFLKSDLRCHLGGKMLFYSNVSATAGHSFCEGHSDFLWRSYLYIITINIRLSLSKKQAFMCMF